jgi:hypothetical protein
VPCLFVPRAFGPEGCAPTRYYPSAPPPRCTDSVRLTDVDMPYVAGSDAELECVFIDRHS